MKNLTTILFNNVKYIEAWDPYEVRSFCISHNLYTRGDSAAYGRMLDYVNEHVFSTEDLIGVMMDIIDHSDLDGWNDDEIGQLFEAFDAEVVKRFYIIDRGID